MESPLQLSNTPIAPRRNSNIKLVGFGVALLIIWAAYAALTRKEPERRRDDSAMTVTRSAPPEHLMKDPEKPIEPPPTPPIMIPPPAQPTYVAPRPQPQPRAPRPPKAPPSPHQETEQEKAYKAALVASPLVIGGSQAGPHVQEVSAQQGQYTLNGTLQPITSPYTILAGTMIPAVLQTGIDSEQPGSVFAVVSQNVYDSATHTYLIVPQGARLQGRYDHETQDGQGRGMVLCERILFPPSQQYPNGSSLVLGGMPAADTQGNIGITGSVNHHFLQAFGRALLYAGISAGTGIAQSGLQGRNFYSAYNSPADIAAGRLGQELDRQSSQVLRRGEGIKPTITIPQAQTFNVEITKDISFTQPFTPKEEEVMP